MDLEKVLNHKKLYGLLVLVLVGYFILTISLVFTIEKKYRIYIYILLGLILILLILLAVLAPFLLFSIKK